MLPQMFTEQEAPEPEADLFTNHNHSTTLENELPLLHITSYGHRRGPLSPPPHIKFDVRALPNPPKAVRTSQSGLGKPLREWLFSNADVQATFANICTRIRSEMDAARTRGEADLRVGVCCELGRHRSVAVVEELARTPFDGWDVVVGHRDVHQKRPSNKSSG